MPQKFHIDLFNLGRSSLLAGFALLAWKLVSLSGIFDSFLFPDPVSVLYRLCELFFRFEILHDLSNTLLKIAVAFLAGSLAGVGAGIIVSKWDYVYKSVSPYIDFFRSIPATALFPLFLLIFGIGDATSTALAIWICALYLSLHVSKGLRSTSETSLMIAKSLKKSEMEILTSIRFKEALPMIFVGFRTAVSLTVVVVIVTEMFVGTTAGLGKAIIDAAYTYDIPKLYAVVFMVGIIGYLLNCLVAAAEKRLVHWQGK